MSASPSPEPPAIAAAPSRRPYWPLVVLAVVAAALVLLPVGLRWGAERWLRAQGMTAVAIDDVDLNLFLGELAIEGVVVVSPAQERLTVHRGLLRVAWWPLVRRRASVESIALEGVVVDVVRAADGSLSIGGLRLGGDVAPQAEAEEEPGKPWGIAVRTVDLRDVQVRYRDPDLAVTAAIHRAHVGPLASWQPDATTPFDLEGEVNGGSVEIDGEAQPFRAEPEVRTTLRVGGLPLAWIEPLLRGQAVEGVAGTLDTDLKVAARYRPATGSAALTVSGNAALDDLGATTPQATLHHLSLAWDGTVDVDLAPGAPALAARGGLTLTDLDLTLPEPAMRITQERATWQGDVDYATAAVPAGRPFLVAGEVALDRLRAVDPAHGEVAAWDELKVAGLRVEGRDLVELATLRLAGLRALAGMAPVTGKETGTYAVTLGELAVDDARVWSGKQVEVAAVRLDALRGEVSRAADGTLSLARWLPGKSEAVTAPEPPAAGTSAAAPEATEPVTQAKAPRGGVVVRVDRFEITGESAFTFADESVDPPFRLAAEPLSLRVEALDQAQPDQASPVEAHARLGKHEELSLTGTVAPFAARPTFALKGSLTSIDLAPLTSYTTKAVGYRLKSGHLDADLDIAVDQGALSVESEWLINKLEMVRLAGEERDALSEGLGLPVNTALSLLRDRDENIRLKVPVTGDLGDAGVRLGNTVRKVVATALVKAINKAVVTYVAVVSSPAAVALAAGKVVSLATALRFDPVAFVPGDATLDAAAADYLDALAERLEERPRVRLNLCGIAVAADAAVLASPAGEAPAVEPEGAPPDEAEAPAEPTPDTPPAAAPDLPMEALRQLAQARGEAVADYLAGRGIAPERLFVCSPEVDDDEGAAPQVEISL